MIFNVLYAINNVLLGLEYFSITYNFVVPLLQVLDSKNWIFYNFNYSDIDLKSFYFFGVLVDYL